MSAEEHKPKREKLPRQAMPEQTPLDRIRNFLEVPHGFPPEIAKIEAHRCIECKKPKCTQGCPVDVNIPEFLARIREGDFLEAAREIKRNNSLPAICGRVCPQEEQCESRCVLGIKGESVSIGRLERFVADY
ncbi:MAG: dihydropyrimidine dehydrogenase, partial [Armatimonadetes bacterium]|nr:dihydropyrimidine dehydrogenase [Armatimonadota bacterium]